MEVSETLKTAWEAVEGADLPERIQEAAFREAVRLLAPIESASPPARGQSRPAKLDLGRGSAAGGMAEAGTTLDIDEAEVYDRISTHTGVERDLLEQLVHLDADTIKVSVPGLRLGRSNAERARAVAQILTITRGFGLEEDGTPLESIRLECERLKVYDRANFSSQLKGLDGFVTTGPARNRRLRARGAGVEAFPALVEFLVGGN
jgi:hypothetical protein